MKSNVRIELAECDGPHASDGFAPDRSYGQFALFGVRPEHYESRFHREQINFAVIVTELSYDERDMIKPLLVECMEQIIPEKYREQVQWIEKPPVQSPNQLGSLGWKYEGKP